MGMNQTVRFPTDVPAWPTVAALLTRAGLPVQMRMIDGELAFPDEEPPSAWRELRIAAEGAMVTLRRESDGVTLVAWSNADAAQRRLYNAAAWALARTGSGHVETATGPLDATAFARQTEMPSGWESA